MENIAQVEETSIVEVVSTSASEHNHVFNANFAFILTTVMSLQAFAIMYVYTFMM